MKKVIHESDGSIVAVHHEHSEDPISTADGRSVTEIPDSDWPSDYDSSSYEISNGELVAK